NLFRIGQINPLRADKLCPVISFYDMVKLELVDLSSRNIGRSEGKSVARQFLVHDTGIVKEIRVARMRDAVGKFLRIGGRDEQHANFLRGWGSLWHRHSGHGIPSIHAQRNVKRSEEHTSELQSREKLVCR